ncbi:hypothetical protein Trydic_g19398 [Trypoxylus dichotomus]
MTSQRLDFSKTLFAIVTGTGRGIGRFITQYLAKNAAPGSKIVGISNLPDKVNQVRELCEGASKDVNIELQISDLSKVDIGEFNSLIDNVLTNPNITTRPYDCSLIVHNAGTVGEVEPSKNLEDLSIWHKYYDLNLFSPILLNTSFLKHCKPYVPHLFIVNISSIFTVSGLPNLSMYCSAKAARNAYFTVLAKEEPDITVLNYSPGAVAKTFFWDELSKKAPKLKLETVTVDKTVTTLFEHLTKGDYNSGGTLDVHGRSLFK